jgi:hypothetical protein
MAADQWPVVLDEAGGAIGGDIVPVEDDGGVIAVDDEGMVPVVLLGAMPGAVALVAGVVPAPGCMVSSVVCLLQPASTTAAASARLHNAGRMFMAIPSWRGSGCARGSAAGGRGGVQRMILAPG